MGKSGGAESRKRELAKLKKFTPPKDAADIRALLAHMVIEMREGKIRCRLATKIAFVAGVFLKAYEAEGLLRVHAELEELKRKVYGNEELR